MVQHWSQHLCNNPRIHKHLPFLRYCLFSGICSVHAALGSTFTIALSRVPSCLLLVSTWLVSHREQGDSHNCQIHPLAAHGRASGSRPKCCLLFAVGLGFVTHTHLLAANMSFEAFAFSSAAISPHQWSYHAAVNVQTFVVLIVAVVRVVPSPGPSSAQSPVDQSFCHHPHSTPPPSSSSSSSPSPSP